MKNTSASARTPRAVGRGARASAATRPASRPSRNEREAARRQGRGADGRPGVAGARRPLPRRGQPRAAEDSVRRGQRAARRGTSGRPRGQASGAGVGRVRVRADVDERRRGQGVTGRTTRDRARAVDAASATTSQTTQARCHTGTSFIHCSRLETYTISYLFIIPFTLSYRTSVADKEQTKSSRQRVAAIREQQYCRCT